jgi:hypothetical protein
MVSERGTMEDIFSPPMFLRATAFLASRNSQSLEMQSREGATSLEIGCGDSDTSGDVKGKLQVTRFHSYHRDVEEALVAKGDVAIDLDPFRARRRELII